MGTMNVFEHPSPAKTVLMERLCRDDTATCIRYYYFENNDRNECVLVRLLVTF